MLTLEVFDPPVPVFAGSCLSINIGHRRSWPSLAKAAASLEGKVPGRRLDLATVARPVPRANRRLEVG